MVLIIGGALRRGIEAAAEAGYPREVCGFMLGRAEADARRVEHTVPVRNSWSDSPPGAARGGT